MEPVKRLLDSWGIISPPEFFFGIGICIAIPLLITSAVFRLLFMKPGEVEGVGWKHSIWGVSGCCLCSFSLLAVFIPPAAWPPDKIPDTILAIMAVGTVIAVPGLLILLVSMFLGLRALRQPRGSEEIPWARHLIFYMPLIAFFPSIVLLYKVKGVH